MTNFRHLLAAVLFLAHAAAVAHEFSVHADASAQLSQLISAAEKLHRMPRVTDPAVAKLIATMSDHNRFIEAAPFSAADMGQLMDMCQAVNRANIAYLLFDLSSHVDKSMQNDPAKVAALTQKIMIKNVLMFQDETASLGAFSQRCVSKQIPLIVEFFKTLKKEKITSERLAGLAQVRLGIYEAYVGAAMAATAPELKIENRKKMIDAMAEVSPAYADVLAPAERKRIRDYVLSLRENIPRELAGQLQKMIDAMSITRCVDLCPVSAPVSAR